MSSQYLKSLAASLRAAGSSPGVIRQHFVAKVEAQHAAQWTTVGVGDDLHVAVGAELALQRLEVALWEPGGAVAMDVVRVEREEAADLRIDFAAQAAGDALAHHGPLLARNREQVGLWVRQDGLAEGHVQVLRGPVGMARRDVAHLQVRDAELLAQFLGIALEGLASFWATRRDTPVDGKGRLTSEWPNRRLFTCASGRTPSI
jgi:hypothetical protein